MKVSTKTRAGLPKTAIRGRLNAHLAKRTDCLVVADMGSPIFVLVKRRFTMVRTINPDGFQPLTQQEEVPMPVPIVFMFAGGIVSNPWLKRFTALGGRVVTVHRLEDAMEALNG